VNNKKFHKEKILTLQSELLAVQDRICSLQDRLLQIRRLAGSEL
jgi:hypothetical protein